MALSVADLNQARVEILGQTVDAPGAPWTTAPPANANTLQTSLRVVTRVLNDLNTRLGGALNSTNGFADRFNAVVGNEAATEQAAFDSIGMTLIEAVAALVAGGGISPAVSFAFEFLDPLDDSDFVTLPVTQDCTIPADLAGAEYVGAAQLDDMEFTLTVEPAGDVIGEVHVAAGNIVSLSGIGGEVRAGDILRMTATDVVGGPITPGAVITILATRKTAPAGAGRFEHDQNVAATTWTITHNLGQQLVAVQVVNTAGDAVLGDVDFATANRCIVTFAKAVAGTAVIRR